MKKIILFLIVFLSMPDIHSKTCEKNCIAGAVSLENSDKLLTKEVYYLYGAEHLKLKNLYFDIPVLYNDEVKMWIDYFLKKGRSYFVNYSQRAGRYAPLMSRLLSEANLPQDLIFLAMAESGFQNNAKSWAKAVGPWQFMPYTGKKYGLKIDFFVDERRDPIKSTIAAAKYLTELYALFETWELAAAGYNAGEGKVGRAVRKYKTENFWVLKKGKLLRSETKNYVPKIMALAIIGKNLEAFGFKDLDFHEELVFEEVEIAPNVDLMELALTIGYSFDELKRLNPELLRWQTPPNVDSYTLRVPVGKKIIFETALKNNPCIAEKYQIYKMRTSTSTLRDVAKKFKIKDPKVLSLINNNISVAKVFQKGTEIKLPFRQDQSIKDVMYADLYERPVRRPKYKRAKKVK